jgi:hypothetical protein
MVAVYSLITSWSLAKLMRNTLYNIRTLKVSLCKLRMGIEIQIMCNFICRFKIVFSFCEIWNFQSSADDDWNTVGYYSLSIGKQLQTFRNNLVLSSEKLTTLIGNVNNPLPGNMA